MSGVPASEIKAMSFPSLKAASISLILLNSFPTKYDLRGVEIEK